MNKIITEYKSNSICFYKSLSEEPKVEDYSFHNHKDSMEILFVIRGDAEFRVESATYKVEPYDTLIATEKELHRMIPKKDVPYERIVICVKTDFFIKNGLSEYADAFFDKIPGTKNLVPYSAVKDQHYIECIKRMEEYIEEGADYEIIKSVMVEILYILSKYQNKNYQRKSYTNKYIQSVIEYINEHLTEEINLDKLCDIFFINKSYLCRIFKKHTGYTINKYITYKRILYVRELCTKNKSITEACSEAGFGNYSNFYKMYMKEMGKSPSDDLKGLK